jgi:hypothetical protein
MDAGINSGDCIVGGGVVRLDMSGNETFQNMALNVTLDGGSLVQFFDAADTSCTAPKTVLTIPAGQSSVGFTYEATSFGKASVIAGNGNVMGELTVVGTALLQVSGTGAIIPDAAACQQDVKFTAVAIANNMQQIDAVSSTGLVVQQNGAINFGPDCANIMSTTFNVTISAGTPAIGLADKPTGSATCSSTGTVTLMTPLPTGLVSGPMGTSVKIYYQGYPTGSSCTVASQCCNGTCSGMMCN